MITPVQRKIILADIANLAEIAFIADIAKLANLAEPSRLRIADKVSRAEPSRFSNGHLYLPGGGNSPNPSHHNPGARPKSPPCILQIVYSSSLVPTAWRCWPLSEAVMEPLREGK